MIIQLGGSLLIATNWEYAYTGMKEVIGVETMFMQITTHFKVYDGLTELATKPSPAAIVNNVSSHVALKDFMVTPSSAFIYNPIDLFFHHGHALNKA